MPLQANIFTCIITLKHDKINILSATIVACALLFAIYYLQIANNSRSLKYGARKHLQASFLACIITLKCNENEFSLLRRRRPCFSTEKRISVEKLRKNTCKCSALAYFYLYYNKKLKKIQYIKSLG